MVIITAYYSASQDYVSLLIAAVALILTFRSSNNAHLQLLIATPPSFLTAAHLHWDSATLLFPIYGVQVYVGDQMAQPNSFFTSSQTAAPTWLVVELPPKSAVRSSRPPPSLDSNTVDTAASMAAASSVIKKE